MTEPATVSLHVSRINQPTDAAAKLVKWDAREQPSPWPMQNTGESRQKTGF